MRDQRISKGWQGNKRKNTDLYERKFRMHKIWSINDKLDFASSPVHITCFAGNERKGSCFVKDHGNLLVSKHFFPCQSRFHGHSGFQWSDGFIPGPCPHSGFHCCLQCPWISQMITKRTFLFNWSWLGKELHFCILLFAQKTLTFGGLTWRTYFFSWKISIDSVYH